MHPSSLLSVLCRPRPSQSLPPPNGLNWRKLSIGENPPSEGVELRCAALAKALWRKVAENKASVAGDGGIPSREVSGIELSKSEWASFGLKELDVDSFVTSEDGACFQPEAVHGQI